MSSGNRITAYGELLVDMIAEAGSDTLTRRPGGAPANFAAGCALLGHETDLVSCVGEDAFGEFLIDAMEDVGVQTHQIQQIDSRTTLAISQLDADSVPSFMFYRDANADTEIRYPAIDQERLATTDHLHFGSLSLTDDPVAATLQQVLEDIEATVSFDPNLREDLMEDELMDAIMDVLDHVDILLCAADELAALAPDSSGMEPQARALIEQHGIDEVVITQGQAGATIITGDDSIDVPPRHVEAIDTTGAGDAFAAGYITARLEDEDPETAGKRGSIVAAHCIRSTGAIEGLPDREDVVR